MTDKDSGSSFSIGFIFGLVVGAAIGLLYAPRPGREVREIIKHKTEEVKEKAGEVAEKTVETAAETRKRVEDKLSHRKAAA